MTTEHEMMADKAKRYSFQLAEQLGGLDLYDQKAKAQAMVRVGLLFFTINTTKLTGDDAVRVAGDCEEAVMSVLIRNGAVKE